MNRSGFTLIETVIYIAITGIMITFLVTAAYQLIGSSDDISLGVVRNEEANFILRKVGWALAGASSINEPGAGEIGTTLSVTKLNFPDNPIVFTATSTDLFIQKGSASSTPLNSSNVGLESFQFEHIAPVGNSPAGVKTTFVIDNTNYEATYYLR